MKKPTKNFRRARNDSGFIPMLILIGIVLLAVVWFAYRHVSGADKNKILNTKNKYENSISR